MNDPRELLRRYLEQRRDMGEREFALDGLDVEAALALIGNAKGQAPAAAPRERPEPSQASAPRAESSRTGAALDAGGDTDWRTALAGSGLGPRPVGAVAPPSAPTPPVASAPPVPPLPEPKPGDKRFAFQAPAEAEPSDAADAPAQAPAASATGDAPDGLVVGQAGGSALVGEVAQARSLEEIGRLVAACAACGLGATKTLDVLGEGDPNADFVVVGEAPGEQEDKTGRPFVGASGQLLTKILAAINLPREQVYICNVIKHRPPGNRNPTPDEVAACSPFLLRQLELVKPKVILAVGTFAAQTLLRTKEPIGKLRGRVHRYYGVPLVVTYHPAALLRNPTWKRPTWDDVQLARRILDRAPRA